MEEKQPIHVLMRFSDKIGAIEDTAEAHCRVLRKWGAVWFGKMGKTLGTGYIERINGQCSRKVPTYLFLVQKGRKGYEVHRGKIEHIRRDLPASQLNLIPSYYETNRIMKYVRLWIKLSKLQAATPNALDELIVSSSSMPVLDSLHSSMAGLFIVRTK